MSTLLEAAVTFHELLTNIQEQVKAELYIKPKHPVALCREEEESYLNRYGPHATLNICSCGTTLCIAVEGYNDKLERWRCELIVKPEQEATRMQLSENIPERLLGKLREARVSGITAFPDYLYSPVLKTAH